jgi:hypothetical protein
VNAETAGGGIPAWTTNIPDLARTNATGYKEAWLPYIEGFAKETAPYQVCFQSHNMENISLITLRQYPDGPVIGTSFQVPFLSITGLSITFVLPAIQSENEYFTSESLHIPGLSEHMQDIIDTIRANGVTRIPTIHNDKNPGGQFAFEGLGKVDMCVFGRFRFREYLPTSKLLFNRYGWDG